ncbi:hypothetical protein TYRP_013928 [Tyrophagus putrescentiae]|nr:hypothetical protein TYRP_003208 [Tyrophagus putrescentiae]KAH9406317.1 hypothetical protein TYRP_013928 [Tyrophagus putrescentiae]
MPSAQRNTSSSLSSFSGRLPFLPRLLLLNPEMTVTWDLLRCFSRLLCIAAVVDVVDLVVEVADAVLLNEPDDGQQGQGGAKEASGASEEADQSSQGYRLLEKGIENGQAVQSRKGRSAGGGDDRRTGQRSGKASGVFRFESGGAVIGSKGELLQLATRFDADHDPEGHEDHQEKSVQRLEGLVENVTVEEGKLFGLIDDHRAPKVAVHQLRKVKSGVKCISRTSIHLAVAGYGLREKAPKRTTSKERNHQDDAH